MKSSSSSQDLPSSRLSSKKGIALVLCLAFLVLITGIILAFFTSVTTELSASKSYASGVNSKQLADSAVQTVMGQIRQATSHGRTVAWASQPGMIHTYDDSGEILNNYKLFSSNQMILSKTDIAGLSGNEDLEADWDAKKAIFTDLNAPVMSGNIPQFPIINPQAAGAVTGKTGTLVDGFSYSDTTTGSAKVSINGVKTPASSADTEARLPMPTKWMYVLKDGTLTAPSGYNPATTAATFTDVAAAKVPTAANPIVGRIAFWTDDETCKLNLNTASGGTPWDPPTLTTALDMQFSRFAPVKNEYNRYPGHPATTSLAPVLWSFSDLKQPQVDFFPTYRWQLYAGGASIGQEIVTNDYTGADRPAIKDFQSKALLLSPRNALGGSSLATAPTGGHGASPAPTNSVDADRLFASVDEAIFGMAKAGSAIDARPVNPFGASLDKAALDKLRFFLTTSSRSPEVNMFNLPKVTMWPIPDDTRKMVANQYSKVPSPADPATRSPVDKLIAFCSTLNAQPYYFTRYDSTSPTNDFKAGSRNMAIYDYLDNLLEQPVPGFGGTFDGRAGRNGSQILTLAADYIRSDINILDSSAGASFNDSTAQRFLYSYTTPPRGWDTPGMLNDKQSVQRDLGTGQVVPIDINGTHGIGRFPTVKSATLMFIARGANQPPVKVTEGGAAVNPEKVNPMHPWSGAAPRTPTDITGRAGDGHPGLPYKSSIKPYTTKNPDYKGPELGYHETQMEAIFFIDPVNVGVGLPGISTDYQIEVSGLKNFQIVDVNGTSQSLFPNVPDSRKEVAKYDVRPWRREPGQNETGPIFDDFIRWGGDWTYDIGKESHTILRSTSPPSGQEERRLNYWSGNNLPAVGGRNTPEGVGEEFKFKGGDVTVKVLTAAGDLVQTLTINFKDSTFPTPRLAANNSRDYLTFDAPPNATTKLPPSRLGIDSSVIGMPSRDFAMAEVSNKDDIQGRYKFTVDTIRSVECLYGDTRLIAGRKNVPSSFFKEHKDYDLKLGTYKQIPSLWDNPSARSAHTLRRSGTDRYIESFNGAVTGASMQPLTDFVNTTTPGFSYFGDSGWRPNPPSQMNDKTKMAASSLRDLAPQVNGQAYTSEGLLIEEKYHFNSWPHTTSSVDFGDNIFSTIWEKGGDFDNGPADLVDGPYINKPGEGTGRNSQGTKNQYSTYSPDFWFRSTPSLSGVFSPNRQIASSVMFGSLPRGIDPGDDAGTLNSAWQTLLFNPNPNSKEHVALGETSLGGKLPLAGRAPDFLFTDFFHMPVVEPYAISEPFSTAGKVNMNYQIAPFSYITRNTALRGVLASTLLTAVPDRWIKLYKNRFFYQTKGRDAAETNSYKALDSEAQANSWWYFRYPIHAEQTLQQFENRFKLGDVFRSPAEICSLFLYPARQPTASSPNSDVALVTDSPGSTTNIEGWWYNGPGGERKSLTGDNNRERPYTTLYPRLTTKSNSYTVHFRVQTLKKIGTTNAAQWVEGKDQVLGEYRGSSLIERYVDTSDEALPDFAAAGNTDTLDNHYKFRVVSTKRFSPE